MAHGSVGGVTTEAKPAKAVNISQQSRLQRGDVAKALAESDVVIEKTYRVPMVHQGYLEPHAVLAQWDTAGNLTLWASTQGSFNTRSEVADVLELSENRIKVIPMECGGGFGGKIRALCEPITAILARATGRPVRYVMTRREELRGRHAGAAGHHPAEGGCEAGRHADGDWRARPSSSPARSPAPCWRSAASFWRASTCGRTSTSSGFEVLTHKPSIAAYRAPVAPQTIFAIDSHMEQLAHAIGADPVEFRLRHLQREGDKMASGQRVAQQRRRRGADAASRSIRCGRSAPNGRRAARRAAACAGRGYRSAAGSAVFSRPAPPCGSIRMARSRC